MRAPFLALSLAATLGVCASPAWAGFFDWNTHPSPYVTEKHCKDDDTGCRGVMVYLDGQEPTERKADNYFYENPNKDWTLSKKVRRDQKYISRHRNKH